jgi:hypothetical protein
MLGDARGTLSTATRNLLDAAQKHILRTDFDLDALTPITPEELAKVFDDPELARQFVQGMTVVSLAEGPPTEAQEGRLMPRFAKALGVAEPAVKVLRELAQHHMMLFRLDFMRRSHLADAARISISEKGFIDTAKAIAVFHGMREDPEQAARCEALGKLPTNTLGYAFYHHCRDHGFAFPGERLGSPKPASTTISPMSSRATGRTQRAKSRWAGSRAAQEAQPDLRHPVRNAGHARHFRD